MTDGFYSMVFETPLGQGGGVAVLSSGALQGGDSSMYYVGTFAETGQQITALVRVGTHLAGGTSVFGVSDANLTISGRIDGDTITGTATAAEVPGFVMNIRLQRLPD